MRILFIAPLPPPISGNSLAVQIFKDELHKSYDIDAVNFTKKVLKNRASSFGRIIVVANKLRQIASKKRKADLIYFSISESTAGNLKDIFIYLLCFRRLPKMIVHLHGGAGLKEILSDPKSWIFRLNRFFIRRLGGVIVLGQSHVSIFDKILPRNKIHIIPNFSEDYLFRSVEEISNKFHNKKRLNILFLSNMIYGKGYNELLEAYLSLDDIFKDQINIDFAGEFGSPGNRSKFLKRIHGLTHIKYWGFVSGNEKKELFEKAHVFCLPTYFRYEGQPISILEAYASGCVVVTTDHSGIKDVFSDPGNGFQVEKRSVESLKHVIERIVRNKEILSEIAVNNRNIADKKYRTTIYNNSLKKVIADMA